MTDLRFFDCNCLIGMRPTRHPETPCGLSDILRDYEYYDIRGGLVHHASAVQYAADWGNRQLLEEIAGQPRLAPQWLVMPHHTSEMAPAQELVAEMLERNVRAARIMPQSCGAGLGDEVWGGLLAALQEARIPVFADAEELDIAAAAGLCKRFPELPVVLCNVSWGSDRLINATFSAVPNLHLDTWAFQGHRAYERFCEQFGSGRLLFSTGLPERSPGAARMMTVYEAISDEDRQSIAGENLMRLMGSVRGAQGELPGLNSYAEPDPDPIRDAIRVGSPLRGEHVVDSHAHLGHPGCMGVYHCALAYNDADGLVGSMDRLGVDVACFSTWGGISLGDGPNNDVALQAHLKYPERLLWYPCINPNYPELAGAEMARVFGAAGVVGFKPYPPKHQVALTDPRNRPMLEHAHKHQWPVLCHMGFGETGSVTPGQVDHLAALYPGASFLCAHAGQSWPMAEAVVGVAKKHRNVLGEITYTAILYGFVEYFVREVNAEQLLFGSDCVMRDIAPQLGWVAWARLPLEQRRLILGGNMARVLRRGVPPRA